MKSVKLSNFMCYKDSGVIPFKEITIFIGENDSGKSAILKALETFLNNTSIPNNYFYRENGNQSQISEIEISFFSLHSEEPAFPKFFIINDVVTIKKIFKIEDGVQLNPEYQIKPHVFDDNQLNEVKSLKAERLKEILPAFGLTYSTVDEAKTILDDYLRDNFDRLDTHEDWYTIKFNDISKFIPQYEHYDSTTISDPTKIIENTLNSIYRSFFYDYIDGEEVLKENFSQLEEAIRLNLDQKISSELTARIQEKNRQISNVTGDYSIDFSSGFHLKSLQVDLGHGCRDINDIGTGSRKRLFLAINEWDKDIRRKNQLRKVIRGYDEPDTSLHVKAQKEIFYAIKSLAEDPQIKIQPIICTHSIVMIDRAPPRIINHIIHKEGKSYVEYLKNDGDDGLRNFLENLSEMSGISTSAFFYERCFIIVEGETEYNALPKMYKKLKNRGFLEIGVIIINLFGNGAWKNFLKLLKANRKNSTILILDSDTQNQNSTKVNIRDLEEIGFDSEFFSNNVFFIGENEFEDIFSTAHICSCLNTYYCKSDGDSWSSEEIDQLRGNGKFSEKLEKVVNKYIFDSGNQKTRFRKPDFGEYISETLCDREILELEQISNVFDKIEVITNTY